jgi:hypothetical protein
VIIKWRTLNVALVCEGSIVHLVVCEAEVLGRGIVCIFVLLRARWM